MNRTLSLQQVCNRLLKTMNFLHGYAQSTGKWRFPQSLSLEFKIVKRCILVYKSPLMRESFYYHQRHNPHTERSRAILKKYPEVRKLMGPNYWSCLYITLILIGQVSLSYWLSDKSWWWVFGIAYFIGSLANHALFAMIHEACHNLVAGSTFANKAWGIVCNLPQAFPSAISFRTYHLYHHSHLAEYDYDADLAHHFEARLVKNSWWRKCLWYLLFMFVEAIRPIRLKSIKLWDTWTVANVIIVIAFNYGIYMLAGWHGLSYLILSTLFGIGLHPVGARWIQEHYVLNDTEQTQETYSYYGPLNYVSFNIGYHNEHHDLFKIPWNNLPKLKKMAPEFYEPLYAHKSWTYVLLNFLFNPKHDLYARNVRVKNLL